MRLISMVDYVLHDDVIFKEKRTFKDLVLNYATFLKQPLELRMFVPCDEGGNVLEKPEVGRDKLYNAQDTSTNSIIWHEKWHKRIEKYQKAKERCLFEDCIYDEEMQVIRKDYGIDLFYIPKHELFTIETMTNYDLKLTQTAIKQIL